MSWLLRRHMPLARAGWRDIDTNHARPNEDPIQKPWRRTNSNRRVWLEGNVLKIADYSDTVFQVGGVSYEQMCFTPNWGCEFDLNIDGNIVQAQYWGACISPSWAKVNFGDLIGLPMITVFRDATSAVNTIRIMVYTSLSSIDTLVQTGTMTGLMNRSTYRFKFLVDRDRLVRVYTNNVLRLQFWLPSGYKSGPGRRAVNFVNQTSAWSEQKNFFLFDQSSIFPSGARWEAAYSDTFNRADGAAGSPWTQYGTSASIVSNSWSTTGTSDGSRLLVQNSGSSGGVQRVEAVIGGNIAPNSATEASLIARLNSTGTDGLACNVFSNAIYLARMSSGPTNPTMTDFTRTTEVTVAAGDTVALSVVGDAAWVELNGALVLAADINGTIPVTNSWRGLRVARRSFTNGASWNSVSLLNAA